MIRLPTAIIVTLLLAGCAHKELKAPCKNVAALAAGDVPCDQREPLNGVHVPSIFDRH